VPEELVHYYPYIWNLVCKTTFTDLYPDTISPDTVMSTDIEEVTCPECKERYRREVQ